VQIGMIGLGRMGGHMVDRLQRGGHHCVVYDRDPAAAQRFISSGADPAPSLEILVRRLATPRVAWLMLPAGQPTEDTVSALGERLDSGDIIVDGGNTFYKDDVRRARLLLPRGIRYVDVGTSGGVWGADRGYCLMVGADPDAFALITPLLRTLAPGQGNVPPSPGRAPGGTAEEGFLHCGPAGAGHFVKMVHNGIEYGLMQAYAEGFDLLRSAGSDQAAETRYDLNVADIAELWRRGSVIGSWLLDLTAMALAESPALEQYTGYVQDSGEGRWTIEAAIERAVPAEVLSAALYARFRSRQTHTFAEKLLSAMREKFGGHREQPGGVSRT